MKNLNQLSCNVYIDKDFTLIKIRIFSVTTRFKARKSNKDSKFTLNKYDDEITFEK